MSVVVGRGTRAWWIAGGLLVTAVVLGLVVGARGVMPRTAFDALIAFDPTHPDHLVVREARLPRTLGALMAGALLGLAGTILQGLTRNPLADPGILGINSMAALFALIAASVGLSGASSLAIAAFLGAAVGALLLWLLSSRRSSTRLGVTIAGLAISAAVSSLSSLLLLTNRADLNGFRHWLLGSLVGLETSTLVAAAPPLVLTLVAGIACARPLNALAMGDDAAASLGVARSAAALALLLVAALASGLATATIGPVVFVGLMAPALARSIAGPDHVRALPIAIMLGASMLMFADVIGRVLLRPAELDAGIVIAVVGAPIAVLVLRRRAR